jgi:hypothetical protein
MAIASSPVLHTILISDGIPLFIIPNPLQEQHV